MGGLVREVLLFPLLSPAVFPFQGKDISPETTLNLRRFDFNFLSFDEINFKLKIYEGVAWLQLTERIVKILLKGCFEPWH